MPTADCRLLHHGRIMRCLTFLLLLPETLKKSKKSGKHSGRFPVCYEILTLSLRNKKMAAELHPATSNTNLPNNGTTVTATDKANDVQVTLSSTTATTPTTQQNINNNNVDPQSWQSTHPTLRERYNLFLLVGDGCPMPMRTCI